MISINVVSDDIVWNKKIKKIDPFFNEITKFFPKKYKFLKKKVSLTVSLSNNKNIKK